MRGDHRWGEADALLQDVVAALTHRDGFELFRCWPYDYAEAGERIERLQDVVFRVAWQVCHFMEEVALGYGRVLEPGDRELTQTEEPVGVPGPLHLQVVSPVEGDYGFLALQLVEDGAVVDAVDRSFDAVAIVEEFVASLDYPGDADGADPVDALGADEVADGLLVLRVDL